MRAARLAALLGWGLLTALAALGLGLSAVVGFSSSSLGRPVVAGLLTRQVGAMISGRLELEAIQVLPQGGLELRGLRLYDPAANLVLQVSSARLFLDLTRLRGREVGVVLELDGPSILLETGVEGEVSLARALSPPGLARPAAPPGSPRARPSWTLRLNRLTVRGGELWWQAADRSTAAEVTGFDLDAEGAYGPAGGFLGLRARAAMSAPVEGPLSLEVAATLRGDRLAVPVLKGALGPSRLEALGEADLASGAFRAALTSLGLEAAAARRLAPAAATGGDLTGRGYLTSDGRLLTAALEVGSADGAGAPLPAAAAVALRLPLSAPAVGFEVALEALDPSRLAAQAPPGRLSLTARGAVAGQGLADGRGRIALELAPSRLRQGELGPISLAAQADRGQVEVSRLVARLPGLALSGSGRWREGGAAGGRLELDGADLALLARNLGALTGAPLPPVSGRLRARATLGGSAAAPTLDATAEAPLLGLGAARAEQASLSLQVVGPPTAWSGRLAASVARATLGPTVAQRLELTAALAAGEATLSLSGRLPDLGPDPLALQAAASLAPDRRGAELGQLSLAWPGARLQLVRPARVTFSPPAVDLLELASGPRRLALGGGLGPRGALEARLEATRLDLSWLPRGLRPADATVRGELSFDARASGTVDRPKVTAHLTLSGGEVRGLSGLQLLGDLGWDGEASRLTADLGLVRAAGGALDLTADLPLPLARARPAEPLSLTVDGTDWPIEALREVAGAAAPVRGRLGVHLALGGTAAAPEAKAALTLDEVMIEDLGPLSAAAALETGNDLAQLTARSRLSERPLLDLTAQLPLDLAGLMLHPEATLRGLRQAPLSGALDAPGLDLSLLAGRVGLPPGLAGTLTATAALSGTAAGPRGQATLAVADGAVAGYRALSGRVELGAGPERTTLLLRAAIGGAEALRLDGSLGVPVERLADAGALRAAPLVLQAAVPDLPLAQAAGPALPLTGTLTARLAVQGTLARPEGRLDAAGAGVEVGGRPLGDLAAVLRYQAPAGTAELSLRPASGGVLWAGASLEAALGLGADPAALRAAPATLKVTSQELDLGFLPALAPGLVRAASGRLDVDLAASGPLGGLRPRGTLTLAGGRLAVAELGDWSDLELSARVGEQALEVTRLGARRGGGRLSGQLALRQLGTPRAVFDGRLLFERFPVARAGMELANLDFPLELSGTLTDDLLDATLTLPGGTVRLPRQVPRTLQSLEARQDITVGRPAPRRVSWFGAAAPAGPAAAPARPFESRARLVLPGKFLVKGEQPTIDVELKGDLTLRQVGPALTAEGLVEVVQGRVEPVSGRVFHVERGRVSFPGEPLDQAQLDAVARYDNPAAVVTAVIGGVLRKPTIQLSSRPAMDEPSIAMLIATGRAELKRNTAEVGTLTAQDEGMARASAALVLGFKAVLADKLPVDQASFDASSIRAGKYLTDQLFVGYTRHFEARPEKGENSNEVRAEYQISPRWNFELRYGDAQAGDASLIWSKDY